MSRPTSVLLPLLLVACTQQRLTGNIQYLRHVHSSFMTFDRDVNIWLPPDYTTNTSRHYPVLYMHDGETLMDATTGGGHEWGVDETAQRLTLAGQMTPTIIVGVYGAGYGTTERIIEYTPSPEADVPGSGKADAYGKFLTQELKPMIDASFRTMPDAAHTGVAGSSDGGLVSMYFGLTLSDTFTRVGAMSPDVRWANNDIVTRADALTSKPPITIWQDVGTNEGTYPQLNINADEVLRDALVNKGRALGEDLSYHEVPGATHDIEAWAARIDQVLRFLFPP